MQQQQSDLLGTIFSNLIKPNTTSDNSMLDNLADIICKLLDELDKANVYYFSMPIWDYLHNCWKRPTVARINMANENEEIVKQFENDNWENWIRIKDVEDNRHTKKFDHTTYFRFFNKASKGFSFIEFFTQHVKTISPIYTIEFSDTDGIGYDGDADRLLCPKNIGEENFKDEFIKQTKSLLTEENLDEKQEEELDAFRLFLSKYKSIFTDLKYIYLISSRLYRQDNNVYIGSGGVILVCKDSIDNSVLQQISVLTNLCYRELGGKNWAEKCRQESIKSAIAAIMSRNMSHNLGSHFISNTKNYFDALIERDPNNKKNYRGIKHALQYIQERMDFIATITSTDTYPFGAVNAKAQIFDELTPDDFGCRHGQESYNFLMDYIVLSEKISKKSWGGDGAVLSPGEHKMLLKIGHWDGKGEPDYWDPDPKINVDENNKKRDEILGINFAIPGGILGRHAVFSIVENIIRNAAKHGQDKIKKDFVIKMLYRTDEHRFVVFDNKEDEDIKGTVKKMEDKLKRLHFLSPDGVLEQENKGLKEMLICAIWLQNENVAQVMADNDYETDKDKKLKNFKKYLEIVALDENGKKIEDVNDDTIGYLGYSFKLDQYEKVHYLGREELNPNGLKGIKADSVCYKENCKIGEKRLSEIFPRFLVLSSKDEIKNLGETEVLRRVLEKNCTSRALQREMVVAYTTEYKDISNAVPYNKWRFDGDAFLFKGHAGKSKWEKFSALFLTKGFEDKYVDSISGGDFTYTLVQPSFVHDEYNMLKIKESVATRFVIIDERIFEHYKSEMKAVDRKDLINGVLKKQRKHTKKIDRINEIADYIFGDYVMLGDSFNMSQIGAEIKSEFLEFVGDEKGIIEFLKKDIEQHYQERRGIYLFNLGKIRDNKFSFEDLSFNVVDAEKDGFKWTGNDFSINSFDEVNVSYNYGATQNNPNAMTFISIHLGIIDKIREQIGLGDNDDDKIVEALKRFFKAKYVSIHTGRGGFDVRESLKQYAFQSFSTIENPLYNSKYLLAQQFYNINYYGSKDKSNHFDKRM